MSAFDADDLAFDESSFNGQVRLFPLPDLVLFPHVMQPLHVFEERYQEMVRDALATDRLLVMCRLKPGWEADYDSRPPIADVGCLGKIVTHHAFEDGRCNLLLMGVSRVRIVHELEPLRSFRQARAELLEEQFAIDPHAQHKRLQQELLSAFQLHLPQSCAGAEGLQELASRHIPLNALTDLVAYTLKLDLDTKQRLLEECCVEQRARLLLDQLQQQSAAPAAAATDRISPPFSLN